AATTMMLARMARSGLITRLRSGLWLIDRDIDRYAIVEALTSPFPAYTSLQTALYRHGMIEQVPSVIYAVSLQRTRRVATSLGVYSIHHIAPELFDGFDERKLASPEKALFDFIYL